MKKMLNTKPGFALIVFTLLMTYLIAIAAALQSWVPESGELIIAIISIVSAIGGYLTGKVGGEFADGKPDEI